MYGEDGEPWLSMRLWYWKEKGTIDVWAYFLTARYCVELIFWMSLKSTLLAFKKNGTSCPNWGKEGGLELIWTKSKRTATNFREAFPKDE